jgi:hypothetical protein
MTYFAIAATVCLLTVRDAWADDAKAKPAADKPAKAAKVEKAATTDTQVAAVDKKAPAKKAADKKPKTTAKKSPQRLPKYYGDVLGDDTESREKVAKLYADYNKKMNKLREQLKAVATERDATLEAALTPTQRKKLAELREQAKK